MSNNDILQNLADIADEELRQQGEKLDRQKKKRRSKSGNKQQKSSTGELQEQGDMSFSEAVGGKATAYMPDPELELSRDLGESDPFEEFARKMNREGNSLKPKGAPEKKPDKKSKGPDRSGKLRGGPTGEIGEEITREQAEQVLSNKEIGGRRAKIILHTKVVDADGRPVDDSREIREAPKMPAEKPVRAEETPSAPQLCLVREDTGEYFDIDRVLLIGRSADNDIVIPNPEGHYVSAEHAQITIRGKDIYLKDLDSTNGTYVNDRKIGSKRIKAGDVIEFADIKFKVEKG